MNKEEKFEILNERNKQNELTFSFIRSISYIIMGLLAFTMLMGLFMMNFFDEDFMNAVNTNGAIGDLQNFIFVVLVIIGVNVGGLIWFSKGEVLGLIGYVLTNLVCAGFFALWVISQFDIFALLLLLYFLSLAG